mgnify:CR=1 FL=1
MLNLNVIVYRNLIKHQFVRFIFVGVINSLFGYGCFALFLCVGFHYTVALFLATIFGVLFNFKSTSALVFRSHGNYFIFRFIGVYIILYFINVIGIKAFYYIGVTHYVGGAILIMPMAVLAFILNKRFVFNYG